MKYIIFGKFSLNHIYFLCYALCILFREILYDCLFGKSNKTSGKFFSSYIVILSRFISIIPFLINKNLSKSRKSKLEQNKKQHGINYIYNDYNKLSKNFKKNIFKVSIFEFLSKSLICIFYFCNNKPEILSYYSLQIYLVINTITQYFISHFVLNYNFYKHHYLSLDINLFCIFIFFIIDITQIINKKISEYPIINILYILSCE